MNAGLTSPSFKFYYKKDLPLRRISLRCTGVHSFFVKMNWHNTWNVSIYRRFLPGLLLCITSIDADCRHNVVKSHVISYENHWIWCEQLYSSALVRFYKISSHWTLFGPFSPLTQKLSTRMHALAAFVLAVVARALPFHVQWHQPLHLVQSGQLIFIPCLLSNIDHTTLCRHLRVIYV